ncbi:amidase [Waterburya agarophytonicola K14]|uniref:Amidase n=1 Tax=Waterburya agarophytonicola KI4 TaxID=2874699 RepID=A0A964FHC5_9CYAN|nr:amidase [Waterburya agarophytonicola]MCC0179021.1 amidase [Waterburya agarophytonicola KI4]
MNIVFATASQLAQMIREQEISSVEVVNAYLEQIEKYNNKINAIATLNRDKALTRAIEADAAIARGENWGALHGVPITLKDTFETAELLTTAGYKPLKDRIPDRDATVVSRLRQGGAIILGKSNLAEMASDFQSTNDLFGRVNNPWNLDCTAGGSSGGSAAAIAAGFSALDLGNDCSGSTRQPAHFCGVYALKPTERRLSTAGHIPEAPGMPKCIRQLMTVGSFARSIEDLRLCLSLTAGTDPRQPDVPPVPLDIAGNKKLSDLTIAVSDSWAKMPPSLEIRQAINLAVDKLKPVCASIENWTSPTLDLQSAFQVCNQLTALNFVYSQPADFDASKKNLPAMFREATQGDKELRDLNNFSHFLPTLLNPNLKQYFEILTRRDRFIAQMDEALAKVDVWLCPVAMTLAFSHRPKGEAIKIAGRKVPYFLANGGYTMLFNLTGHPVVVIPIGQSKTGLPIGVQIVGKRWQEMALLAIAEEIDKVVGNFYNPCLETTLSNNS